MVRPAGGMPLAARTPTAGPLPVVDVLSAALHGGTPPQRIHVLQRSNSDSSDSDSDAMLLARREPVARGVRSASETLRGSLNPASPVRSSVSSAASSTGSGKTTVHSTVVPVRRSVQMKERVSSDGSRKWRVLDSQSGSKLFGVNIGESGPKVMCSTGAILWSVLPYVAAGIDTARAKILHKNGSPFFVVLAAQRWAPRIERKAYGHVHALPHVKRAPELAIEIHGDSLGKRFQVVGYDGSGGPAHIIASARRSTRFQNMTFGGVEEVAVWDVDVEANVDSAMVSSVLFVLNDWELRPPSHS